MTRSLRYSIVRSPQHVVTALLLLTVLQACSQFGGMAGGRHGGGERRTGREDNNQRPLDLARMSADDQIRLRLTDLRIALNLTAEQAAPWQAYESKVIDMLAASEHAIVAPSGGNAINQVDARIAAEQKRAAAAELLAHSARKLYAVLNEEQKRTADRLLAGTVPTAASGALPPARGARQ